MNKRKNQKVKLPKESPFKKSLTNGKKNSLGNYLVLIIAWMTVILGSITSFYTWQDSQTGFTVMDLFYFSRQSNLLALIVVIFSFTKMKKKPLYNYLSFIALIDLLINALFFNYFLEDKNKYYPVNSRYVYYLFYYLEYIIMPIVFSVFYAKNKQKKLKWKEIWLVATHPLIYFVIYYLVKQQNFQDIFISPDDKKHLSLMFAKIIFVFLFLSSGMIFMQNKKMNKCLKSILFFLIFLIIYLTTYGFYDWKHAQEEMVDSQTVGAFIAPLSPFASKKLSDIVDKKDLGKDDYIIELGGGSGNVTQYILERYGQDLKLAVIEYSPAFVKLLKQRFPEKDYPNVKIIQGDAVNLIDLLQDKNIDINKIKGIVSTLPLSLFNDENMAKLNKDLSEIMTKNKGIKFKEYRFKCLLKEIHRIDGTTSEKDIHLVDNFIIPIDIYTLKS
ncbi:rRNA adenine N-6-methyltransferase family protein [Candidatus Phytoplasma pruni]|uniref:Methyltransferase domain-containing protein n=1 Tax=Candidatus Phytoplasma pruni TaxID=479893 RepID=A0A851H9S8_9MOLU|nr:rRNA adenine N-6-methyltransferase family protein [Candidatus Phytoplasma pruni]NWN45692.1 methyltransferase domain-containing protein [Candidatus Phytoplasma pruni]